MDYGTAASLQSVALNFRLKEDHALTDHVIVIQADQQVARELGQMA